MSRKPASSDVFYAIADPTRRRMLELLRDEERSAGDLAGAFRMSQPSASQHLRVLRDSGLVRQKRVGRTQIYRIRPRQLRAVVDWVAYFDKFWEERLDRLGKYLEKEEG